MSVSVSEYVSECVHVRLGVDLCLSGGPGDSVYVQEWAGVHVCECGSQCVSVCESVSRSVYVCAIMWMGVSV